MTVEDLQSGYSNRVPLFDRSLKNVKQAIEVFLEEHNINYLTVTGRVKSLDSFIDKDERKKYSNPFQDNEDFIGIRIIVYYPKDIEAIQEIIDTEFDLQDSIDKIDELEVNEFGYRSNHSIVKIKKEWLAAPNYRGLEEIKIEFQVRTILMHAWAEISRQLSYKKKNQIPTKEMERQLFLLSANFENSDKQLQNLKDGIENYKDEIKLSVEISEKVSDKVELNIDSISALLDYYLPGSPSNQKTTLKILNNMKGKNVTIEQIEELLKKIRPFVASLNETVFPNKGLRLTQGTILDYAEDIFISYDPDTMYSESRKKIVEKFREIVKTKNKEKK